MRDTRYEWAYIFGAVCPERGIGAGLVLPRADTEAMNLHLVRNAVERSSWISCYLLEFEKTWG